MGQLTENCDIVGLSKTRQIMTIDNGLEVSFNDADVCIDMDSQQGQLSDSSPQPRKAVFQILCAETDDSNFKIVQGQGCTTIF